MKKIKGDVEIDLKSGEDFKQAVLQVLSKDSVMPHVVLFWDKDTGWGLAYGKGLASSLVVRRNIISILKKFLKQIGGL